MSGQHLGRVTAIIVGAGKGVRFGASDKVLSNLNGRPVLAHAIDMAQAASRVDNIVVVVGQHIRDAVGELAQNERWSKLIAVCVGGERRQDSVEAGLVRVPTETTLVAVHDGARPLAESQLFDTCIEAAAEHGAAIAAVPVTDTLKRVLDGLIIETVSRNGLWAAQTPQVFRRRLLESALEYARGEHLDVTDEASLFERMGLPVAIVKSSMSNLKITVPEDLALAAALIAGRVG